MALLLPQIEAIPYVPVASADTSSAPPFSDGKGSLHFFYRRRRIRKREKMASFDNRGRSLLSLYAGEIQELIEKERKEFGDFAVLVKDRYQAERLFQYFSSLSFPSLL